jgi:hypothetical protein
MLASLAVLEMMRIPIVCSLYKIPFKKFAICSHSDNAVNCIYASSFPSSQNEVHVVKTPVISLSSISFLCVKKMDASKLYIPDASKWVEFYEYP